MEEMTNVNPVLSEHTSHELSSLLAVEFMFYAMTHNADWNVGDKGISQHQHFFKKQSSEVEKVIDQLTGRIVSLGVFVPDALQGVLKLKGLKTTLLKENDCREYIRSLLSDHESHIDELHRKNELIQTNHETEEIEKVMIQIIEQHQKMADMLRVELQSSY